MGDRSGDVNTCCDGCGVYLTQPHVLQVSRDLRTLARLRLCVRCGDQAEAEVQAALASALRVRVSA